MGEGVPGATRTVGGEEALSRESSLFAMFVMAGGLDCRYARM